jgi:hypothetical protein
MSQWSNNTKYNIGDVVIHENITYQCILAHTSIITWAPGIFTQALWKKTDALPTQVPQPQPVPQPIPPPATQPQPIPQPQQPIQPQPAPQPEIIIQSVSFDVAIDGDEAEIFNLELK